MGINFRDRNAEGFRSAGLSRATPDQVTSGLVRFKSFGKNEPLFSRTTELLLTASKVDRAAHVREGRIEIVGEDMQRGGGFGPFTRGDQYRGSPGVPAVCLFRDPSGQRSILVEGVSDASSRFDRGLLPGVSGVRLTDEGGVIIYRSKQQREEPLSDDLVVQCVGRLLENATGRTRQHFGLESVKSRRIQGGVGIRTRGRK